MKIVTRIVVSALICTVASLAARANDNPPFPRLAGVNNGGPFTYNDKTYQAKLAKLDLVILGYWPKFAPGGQNFNSVVTAIKAINPDTKVFLYTNSMELTDLPAGSSDAWAEKRAKLNSMNWWLYSSGGSGSRVLSDFGGYSGTATYSTNVSLNTPRDSNGYRYSDWIARWTVTNFYTANPAIDGMFEDNVFWKNHVSGDWNRDGTPDGANTTAANAWIRAGYQNYFNTLKSLMPGHYQMGNMGDWGAKEAVYPELQGVLNGGLMEGLLGRTSSPEAWASWSEMMRWYRKTMSAVAFPKLVIFQQNGTITDYKAMRYGLTSCLMDDAYYSFHDNAKGGYDVAWFDEYDSNLGAALSGPSLTPWSNGVYRRDFQNGIALVNPRGNGQVTVTIEAGFKRIDGSQDRSVNNGQAAQSVTLADRDGIILLRTSAAPAPSSSAAKPTPPQSVVVQ